MAGSESPHDLKNSLAADLRENRLSIVQAREELIKLLTIRNMMESELKRKDTRIADLQAKIEFAEKVKKPELVEEIKVEIAKLLQERTALDSSLIEVQAKSEAAKIGHSDDEGLSMARDSEIRAQYAQRASDIIERASDELPFSDTDNLWERAAAKTNSLTAQAAAIQEAMLLQSSKTSTPNISSKPPQKTIDELLLELEARLIAAESTSKSNNRSADPSISEVIDEVTKPKFALHIKGDLKPMAIPKRVRVAGIGTGGIFRGAHLPPYVNIPQAQLVALCDPDKEAQDLAYKRFQRLTEEKVAKAKDENDFDTAERLERDLENIVICEDISQVIEKVKPDLVDICTQPFLHAPLSIQALEAGINVMCEKPLSRSWLESERLIPAIKRSGKIYQHNENWLWEPDYYTAKKLVDSGAIGEPIVMFLAQAHGGPEGNGKFWDPANGGGGALLDNGIHAIGAAWFVCGMDKKPTMVKAAEPFGMSIRMPDRIIDGRFQKVTVDDDAHILIRFEDEKSGAWSTAHIEGSWSERDSPETAIIGTTGTIRYKNEDGKRFAVVYDSYDREQRRMQCSGSTWAYWPSGHYGEMLNMVECVRNNVHSICTAEFGADNSAIVGASYLSEKNGKRSVHVEEFKTFARGIAAKYPNDPKAADDALVDSLLSAVREKK